jgi:hypothetical protein
MNKNLPLSLILAAFAFGLAGCQKEEAAPAAVSSPAANAAAAPPAAGAAPAAPRQNLPPAVVEQMTKSLNDPNTPPDAKAKIRQQLGQ